MFQTTAIYPNRIEDKKILENKLRIPEEGIGNILFSYQKHAIAKGYERIVFGDHGAYIEFTREQLLCELVPSFGILPAELPEERKAKFYYYWCKPLFTNNNENLSKAIYTLDLKIYWQIKPVTDLPNAPKRTDGKKSNFNRQEGYADYKRGFYYINPYDLVNKYI